MKNKTKKKKSICIEFVVNFGVLLPHGQHWATCPRGEGPAADTLFALLYDFCRQRLRERNVLYHWPIVSYGRTIVYVLHDAVFTRTVENMTLFSLTITRLNKKTRTAYKQNNTLTKKKKKITIRVLLRIQTFCSKAASTPIKIILRSLTHTHTNNDAYTVLLYRVIMYTLDLSQSFARHNFSSGRLWVTRDVLAAPVLMIFVTFSPQSVTRCAISGSNGTAVLNRSGLATKCSCRISASSGTGRGPPKLTYLQVDWRDLTITRATCMQISP